MRLKIAFGGTMGSGKDTAVQYLLQKESGTALSFAKPIYDILRYAQKVCGLSKTKDRLFLQLVGSEWGRKKINPDIWVELALAKVPEEGNVFISDLRHCNESQMLKRNGWILIRIDRTATPGREGTGSSSHSSEKEISKIQWDFFITNDSSLASFYKKIDKIIATIKQ